MELSTATHFATLFIVMVVVLLIIAFVVADYMARKVFPLPSTPDYNTLENHIADQLATLDQINENLTHMWLGLQPEHRDEFPVTQEDLVSMGELIDKASEIAESIRRES